MLPKLEATDIIPLVNKAFACSFGQPEFVSKAILERGWYPANYNILLDKEFNNNGDCLQIAHINNEKEHDLLINSLNVSTGAAGTVLQKLVWHASQSEGIQCRYMEMMVEGKQRNMDFSHIKKFTSGIMIKQGLYSLNHPAMLTAIKENKAKKISEQQQKDQNENKCLLTLKTKVQKIRSKKGHDVSKYSTHECKDILQFKKRKGDPAMPSSIEDLRARAKAWQQRLSPNPLPLSSNDED